MSYFTNNPGGDYFNPERCQVRQHLLNEVWNHLEEQGHPCMRGDFCAYRDGLGGKCAAGIFIPDASYLPQMEKEPWDMVCTYGVDLDKRALDECDFVCELQTVHDCVDASNFVNALQNLITKRLDGDGLWQGLTAPWEQEQDGWVTT